MYNRRKLTMAWLGALLAMLTGCNPLAIGQIKVGVSNRADVLRLMGQPESVRKESAGTWAGADLLEYSGQPEGTQNWQIVVGSDDTVKDVRQLLVPENFAKVFPGMGLDDVRGLLGKPAKVNTYALSPNRFVEWRYMQPPNEVMIFTVEIDPQQRVVKSGSARDDSADRRGG
jgi:outer membrane protein assembly factor BamE (lipoprotein component of BamABCDE complex)